MEELTSKYATPISVSFFILIATMTLFLMVYGQAIFIPIIIAIVIWFLINYMTERIQQVTIAGYPIPRKLAMSLGLILLTFLAIRIGRLLYVTSLELMTRGPSYRQNLDSLLQDIPPAVWALSATADEAQITADIDQIFALVTDYLSTYATSLATDLTGIVTQSILVLIYVIFLLLEQNTFTTKLNNMFPNARRRAEVETIIRSIKEQVQKYFAVKTFVSVLTGVVSFVVMWLFGLDFAEVWAILIALLNFIPYIGSIIAVLFPVMIALLQFGNWPIILGLAALLVTVQTAVSYFVEPLLMGNSLDISPFVTLVALAVFGTIWGIAGMFLSIPIIIILIIVFSHFDVTRPIAVMLSGNGVVYGVAEDETPGPG